jgi:hypothetical protein
MSRIAFFQSTWGAGDCGAGILPASSMLPSKIFPRENNRNKRPRCICGLLAQAECLHHNASGLSVLISVFENIVWLTPPQARLG